ncbi:MAG: cytochrome b/b6 domain-containing protein [Candidatus Rickettsia vulgarisii]
MLKYLPIDLPRWQKIATNININMLYLLMSLMPVSGFLMTILSGHNIDVYGLFTINSFTQNKGVAKIFEKTHLFSAIPLVTLIVLHVFATIHHHFIRKDDVFKRMWFYKEN